jgi:Kef-type K+ transport system membrane component KefB
MRLLLPKIQNLMSKLTSQNDTFQDQLRSVFLTLFGTVLIFQLLGLHSIVGGFFAGLVLSESLDHEIIKGKIRALSYGFFIPTFFVYVGTQTDISLLADVRESLPLVFLVVGGVNSLQVPEWLVGGVVGGV